MPAVRKDAEASKAALRKEMIGAFKYDAGIFVGGMDGVEKEYALFREAHPNVPTYPIASTGAASVTSTTGTPAASAAARICCGSAPSVWVL